MRHHLDGGVDGAAGAVGDALVHDGDGHLRPAEQHRVGRAVGARGDGLAVGVGDVVVGRRHAPGEAVVEADDHARNARKRGARDVDGVGAGGDREVRAPPDRRRAQREVRIVGEHRVVRPGDARREHPVVAPAAVVAPPPEALAHAVEEALRVGVHRRREHRALRGRAIRVGRPRRRRVGQDRRRRGRTPREQVGPDVAPGIAVRGGGRVGAAEHRLHLVEHVRARHVAVAGIREGVGLVAADDEGVHRGPVGGGLVEHEARVRRRVVLARAQPAEVLVHARAEGLEGQASAARRASLHRGPDGVGGAAQAHDAKGDVRLHGGRGDHTEALAEGARREATEDVHLRHALPRLEVALHVHRVVQRRRAHVRPAVGVDGHVHRRVEARKVQRAGDRERGDGPCGGVGERRRVGARARVGPGRDGGGAVTGTEGEQHEGERRVPHGAETTTRRRRPQPAAGP